MRIDLSLKGFQFKFLQSDLIDIHFINKAIDLIHHSPKASDQNAHLVLTVAVYHNLPASMIHLIHIGCKLFNFSGKQPGKKCSQHKDNHAADKDQRNLFQKKPGHCS